MSSENQPPDSAGSVTQIVRQLQVGDSAAIEKLWQQFFPRLLGLARKTLSQVGGHSADAEDAVQSAFAAFWQRIRQGDFAGGINHNRAWQLLATITVRKVLKARERQRTQKRGGDRVITEAALTGNEGQSLRLDELLENVSAPDFDLACEEFLLQLDDEPRAIVLLRLSGHTNREIAGILGCTERKIERKLQIVRLIWKRQTDS